MFSSILSLAVVGLQLISGTSAAPASTSALPAPGALTQISNFGSNPTNVGMFAYAPSGVSANPALIVALHYCGGTAQAYFQGTQLRSLADSMKNFVLLYGNAPTAGGCWDVASTATLTHNAGGDSLGIASAARYAISNWGVNANKVFVTGTSSGAMMTNVLAGSYPDVFKAGAAYSGVPFGCFAGPSAWNSQCSTGQLIKTPQQWGAQVKAAFPGLTGTYPKMQIWHGTADTTLAYPNFQETIKEWTNVFNISQTPTTTTQNDPQSGYTHTIYGSGQVVGYSAAGVGHTVPEHEDITLAFFGLE